MTKILWVCGGVAALLGCGGDAPAVPAQSDFRGTWAAPRGTAGCVFAVTFSAEETYGAGIVCKAPASSQVDVDWGTGTFTLAPDGRINFYPLSGGCRNWVTYAEYGGPAYRPTITMPTITTIPPNPYQDDVVLVPSATTVPADAIHGCFAADWSFTASTGP